MTAGEVVGEVVSGGGASQIFPREGTLAMNALTSDVKHEAERGVMVKILVDWSLEWMPFYELRLQLARRLGYHLSESQIQFHLNYLTQGGYAEIKQLRAGRAELELTAVRATVKAADLLEGRAQPDPGIGL